MCDPTETAPGTGWRGWNTGDVLRPTKAAGDWVDLTWPLSPSVPRIGSFPPPRIERIASIPDDPLAAAEWLVDKKIKLLAVDTPTPDIPIHKRPAELLFLPLDIVGGDGAPARVLGRAIRD